MKANSVETIQTARKLNKAKVPIKEIAIKLNVCENTVRLWTCQDRHSSKDVFKQWFKKMYIQPGFTYAEFEYHTGLTVKSHCNSLGFFIALTIMFCSR